ncbi:MAG: hypothetical protein H0X02_04850 [Nitrosomonas sp.]|nr:hypothetical protein [Nitrosomonas sp.]
MNEYEAVPAIDVLKSSVNDVNSEIVGLKFDINIRDSRIKDLEDEKKFAEDQVTYWQGVAAFERSLNKHEAKKFDESIFMLYLACIVASNAIGFAVFAC